MKPPRSGAARGAILCERLHDAATVLMLAGVALLPFPWVGFHDRPSRAVK